eukprot:524904_1
MTLSKDLQYIKLLDYPVVRGSQSGQTLYYPKGNCIFLITQTGTSDSKMDWIYKYDLATSLYSVYMKFPWQEERYAVFQKSVIINDELWTIFGKWHLFIIIDLKTDSIIRNYSYNHRRDRGKKKKYNILYTVYGLNAIYIPSPINEIHVTYNSKHIKYNSQIDEFQNIGNMNDIWRRKTSFLFIEFQSKLIVFGGIAADWSYTDDDRISDKMWYCDIKSKHQTTYEWKVMNITLPDYENQCNKSPKVKNPNSRSIIGPAHLAINIFDTIIVLFYFNSKHIWVLDLLHDDCKWIKHNKKFPKECDVLGIVKVNNFIHFRGARAHFKISVFDIVPQSIYNKYGARYCKVIDGVSKEFQNNCSRYIRLPLSLTKLIALYYCGFKYQIKK